MPLVLIERDAAVATVTLNRPEAMNALSRALSAELAAAIHTLAGDEAIRAIVLTGADRCASWRISSDIRRPALRCKRSLMSRSVYRLHTIGA